MIPKKIKKNAFFTFENKAEYILECINLDKSILEDTVKIIMKNELDKKNDLTTFEYIETIYCLRKYIEENYTNNPSYKNKINELGNLFFKEFLLLKTNSLLNSLNKEGIRYLNLEFFERENNVSILLGDKILELNTFKEQIRITRDKNYILNKKSVISVIELMGLYIERKF